MAKERRPVLGERATLLKYYPELIAGDVHALVHRVDLPLFLA